MNNYQLEVLTYINANEQLSQLFGYYMQYCTSACLPYHNLNHTFKMMWHIIQISKDKEYDISNEDLLVLLSAAIFHDYNHSGGMFSDMTNVNIAVGSFVEACDSCFGHDEYPEFIRQVENCIYATEYPYSTNELTLLQRIVRECDILSQLHEDVFTHTMYGLKQEMHIHSWRDCIKNYTNFLQDVCYNELKLAYSNQYVNDNLENILNIINLVTTVYTNGTTI